MTTKVSAAMQDLTDDYAFSGTVSGAGKIVQVVNVTDGAVATGTTVLPRDNSTPQITEGNEFLTLAITAGSASNKLFIQVVLGLSTSVNPSYIAMALFNTDFHASNAMASQFHYNTSANGTAVLTINHYMTAPSASATTFRVRAGLHTAGTTTFNGLASSADMNGTHSSSITITEIAV